MKMVDSIIIQKNSLKNKKGLKIVKRNKSILRMLFL
jgi:hypothetical protein